MALLERMSFLLTFSLRSDTQNEISSMAVSEDEEKSADLASVVSGSFAETRLGVNFIEKKYDFVVRLLLGLCGCNLSAFCLAL